jgi:hypothetical protein
MPSYQPFEEVVKPKTQPTLSQLCRDNPEKVPNRSVIKMIMFPKKFPNFTFVTEHNFRVLVYEDNPMFDALKEQLHVWSLAEEALFVKVVDKEKGWWTFELDTDEVQSWEKTEYGYSLKIQEKKKTSAKKTSRSKAKESATES